MCHGGNNRIDCHIYDRQRHSSYGRSSIDQLLAAVTRETPTTAATRTPIAFADDQTTRALCDRLREIKTRPMKDEPVDDPAYKAIKAAGEAVVPCLIEKVTDTTRMLNPVSEPHPEITVGDLAYFLILEITGLDFLELLPQKVKVEYKAEGAPAYYRYVAVTSHRIALQQRLKAWQSLRAHDQPAHAQFR